jgi:hypothetical protein
MATPERRTIFTIKLATYAAGERFAAAGGWYRRAVGRIFVELVAQRADRYPQDIGGVGVRLPRQSLSVSRIRSRSTDGRDYIEKQWTTAEPCKN